jgi:hypothetical protein
MEQQIELIKAQYPSLIIERKEYKYAYQDDTKTDIRFLIHGFNGNPELEFSISEIEDLQEISSVLEKQPTLFKEIAALRYDNVIEVLLDQIQYRSFLDNSREDERTIFEVTTHYFKNDLSIKLVIGESMSLLPKLLRHVRASIPRRRSLVLRIEGLEHPTSEGIEVDVRNILTSVLFEIEYNYDLLLEAISVELLSHRAFRRRIRANEIPDTPIPLVYKKYILELIQYFHLAEKVDYLPFKFLCYYHIVEYFLDKSAFHIVSAEIKNILQKPDFHMRTDYYVNVAINLFKVENDKIVSDKTKIERVLRQYIIREDLKNTLAEINQLDYFSKEVIFECSKQMKLPAIGFENDGNFYNELTKRLYSLRCSIVHSNPDFDEQKAIPFKSTTQNLERLRTEIELEKIIARIIIVETKE